MSGGFRFSELDFGTLNRFKEGVGGDADPRRDNSLGLLNRALEKTYGPQSLNSVETFQGIVVGKREVNRAAFQKKGSVLLQLSRAGSGASDTVSVDAPYFVYKVYIPELEARPRPLSGKDPVIQTYADVYVSVDVELKYGELPMGGLAYVKYADKENLLDPMIVGYDGNVAIEWSDAASLTRKTYKSNSKKKTKKLPKGCEMFVPSKKGNPHNALAIGASYTRWWSSYASDHNLKMDRFASSGKTIAYIKKQFVTAVEDGECFSDKNYDYVFFFVGPNSLAANGNGKTPYNQLMGLVNTVKSKFPGIKTAALTIQGWSGWGLKRGWITSDPSNTEKPSGWKLTRSGRGIVLGTKEYNRLIKGGSFDYVVDWAPVGTVNYTSDDPEKFILKPEYDADLLHPNDAAHKIIAKMVKEEMGW